MVVWFRKKKIPPLTSQRHQSNNTNFMNTVSWTALVLPAVLTNTNGSTRLEDNQKIVRVKSAKEIR